MDIFGFVFFVVVSVEEAMIVVQIIGNNQGAIEQWTLQHQL